MLDHPYRDRRDVEHLAALRDMVELAAVPIVGGVIGEPMSWLVKPDRPIKHFATRIHGLTNKDVADCPSFEAIKDEALSTIDADILVAHNAHVDVGVLARKLGVWKAPEVFDTLMHQEKTTSRKVLRMLVRGWRSRL
ncbi:MAG: 3'-5' exonuclease [Pseudonocardiaceae bacterium]